MVTINLKGREIPLLFTAYEMKTVQEEIAPNEKVMDLVSGKDPENPDYKFGSAEHLTVLSKMIRIMGNAGLEEDGQEPDLTNKKVLRALSPRELVFMVNACVNAVNDGFRSEIPPKEEAGPVDVTLEELNKKKETDG